MNLQTNGLDAGRTRTDREGRSQCERIFGRLKSRVGEWVAMPELALAASRTGIGMAVHSRVADLRARGYAIEHRNERGEDGMCESYYRLMSTLP